jgi:hypothetical protein
MVLPLDTLCRAYFEDMLNGGFRYRAYPVRPRPKFLRSGKGQSIVDVMWLFGNVDKMVAPFDRLMLESECVHIMYQAPPIVETSLLPMEGEESDESDYDEDDMDGLPDLEEAPEEELLA